MGDVIRRGSDGRKDGSRGALYFAARGRAANSSIRCHRICRRPIMAARSGHPPRAGCVDDDNRILPLCTCAVFRHLLLIAPLRARRARRSVAVMSVAVDASAPAPAIFRSGPAGPP
jgi:hypothetical protein